MCDVKKVIKKSYLSRDGRSELKQQEVATQWKGKRRGSEKKRRREGRSESRLHHGFIIGSRDLLTERKQLSPPPFHPPSPHLSIHLFSLCSTPRPDLLSKSRKKCGQFSISLVRTFSRLPIPANLMVKIQYGKKHNTQQHMNTGTVHTQRIHNTLTVIIFVITAQVGADEGTSNHQSNVLLMLSSAHIFS